MYYTSHLMQEQVSPIQFICAVFTLYTPHNCISSSIFYIYYSCNGLCKHYTFSDSSYNMMYSRISWVCSSSTCFCLMCIHRNTCDCRHTDTCEDQASNKMGTYGCSDMSICYSLGCNSQGTSYHRRTGTYMDQVCNMVDTSYHRHTGTYMDPVCNMVDTSYHRHTCTYMDQVCNMVDISDCSDMNICSSLGCSSEGIYDYIHTCISSNQICMNYNISDMNTCNHAGSCHKLLLKPAI